jgi:hypothetical protein
MARELRGPERTDETALELPRVSAPLQMLRGQGSAACLTNPLANPPAPNGQYKTEPVTKLPAPGFYMPWFFGRAFRPIQFDCKRF